MYVDDIVITDTSTAMINSVIKYINDKFKLTDLSSLNYFLRMEVTSGDDCVLLNQKKYV